MKNLTPHLETTFKMKGTWQQIIDAIMELPPNMPQLIRNMWIKNAEIARQNGVVLTPQEFAEMFVDANLR